MESYEPKEDTGVDSSTDDFELLQKFNWGAFLMCGLWSLIYRQWGWLLLFLVIGYLQRISPGPIPYIVLAFYYLSAAVLGSNANRIAWEVHGKSFGTIRKTIEAQKKWLYWGIGLNAISVIYLLALLYNALSG